MDEDVLILSGLPLTCNPIKMKLRFESECKVHILHIKVESGFAEVTFATKEDCKTFRDNLPERIKFGNEEHTLAILDQKPAPRSTNLVRKSDLHHSKAKESSSHPQTWSSLSKLPSCECGLLVQPTSQETKPDDLKKYFESNVSSCGGLIEAIIPMIDGILVIYKDEGVAEKVWNARPHRINKKPVVLYLKTVPPKHKQQLIIKAHEMKLHEDDLRRLLNDCSKNHVRLKNINQTSKGAFFVAYENDTEEKDIQRIVEEFREKNPNIGISYLYKNDCIYVANAGTDLSDHEVKMFFENSARSGGGPVTRIDHVEQGGLIIYFSSYKDAGAVFDKSLKRELQLFGNKLKIHQYFHNVHEKKLQEENPLDALIEPWLDNKSCQRDEAFDSRAAIMAMNESLSSEMKEFFQLCPEQITEHGQLAHLADIKVSSKGFEVAFKSDDEEQHKNTVHHMENFLANFKYERFHVKEEVARQIIDKDLSTGGCNDGVCFRWTGPDKRTLIISGLITEVDRFVQYLGSIQNTQPLELDTTSFRWLFETGTLKQLKKDHKAIAHFNQTHVFLFHDHENFLEAKQAIEEMVEKLSRQKFIPKHESFALFLRDGKSNANIFEGVASIFKNCVPAIFSIKHEELLLVGPPECLAKAMLVLNEELIVDESFYKGNNNEKLAAAWSEVVDLQQNGRLKMLIQDNVVTLVGFRKFIDQARNALAQARDMFEQQFKMEPTAAKHLLEYRREFVEFCKTRKVLIDVNQTGILLKGQKKNVDKVLQTLESVYKGIVKESEWFEHFNATDYLHGKDGMNLLSVTGEIFQSTIIISSKTQPQPTDVASYGSGQNGNIASSILKRPAPPISIQMGPLKVSLRKGDIIEEDNDIIVNSAGPGFDLSTGAISRAILDKGGLSIQAEVKEKARSYICTTSGGKLNCQRIIHIILPTSLTMMKECLVDVLKEAAKQQARSISIPPIGTGFQTNRAIARMMYESIQDFVKKPANVKNMRALDIVLFDDIQMTEFREEFSHLHKASSEEKSTSESWPIAMLSKAIQPLSSIKNMLNFESDTKSRMLGRLTVSVRQGDITDQKSDAIVNSTNSKFDLSRGMVSQRILFRGGSDIQKQVYLSQGEVVRVTGGGALKCKNIIHVNTPRDIKKIGGCLFEILKVADTYCCASVSVPAIGTGNLDLPVQQVAKIMLKAVEEFEQNYSQWASLTKIDFVIYDKYQMRDFRDAFFGDQSIPAEASKLHETGNLSVKVEAYSFEKDKAKQALKRLKEALDERLGYAFTVDIIGNTTEQCWKDYARSHEVHITKQDGQFVIKGMKENIEAAKNAIQAIAKRQNEPGLSKFMWEYKDESLGWRIFDDSLCKELEILYEKYRSNHTFPPPSIQFKGESTPIDFKSWIMGTRTKILRFPLKEFLENGSSQTSANQSYDNPSGYTWPFGFY